MFIRILAVALGGALGALSRWGVAQAVTHLMGRTTPLGTAAANILGCFLFGVVWGLTEEKVALDPVLKTAVLTGFMGAFTTFSTFIFETSTLDQVSAGAANIVGQVLLGLAALWLGLLIGR